MARKFIMKQFIRPDIFRCSSIVEISVERTIKKCSHRYDVPTVNHFPGSEFQLHWVQCELITYQSEFAFFVLITIFVLEDFDFRLVQSSDRLGIFRRSTIKTDGSMQIKLSLAAGEKKNCQSVSSRVFTEH
jgi:hypothetical protein